MEYLNVLSYIYELLLVRYWILAILFNVYNFDTVGQLLLSPLSADVVLVIANSTKSTHSNPKKYIGSKSSLYKTMRKIGLSILV